MNGPITPPDSADYPMDLNSKRKPSGSDSLFARFPKTVRTTGVTLPPLVNASITAVPASNQSMPKCLLVFGGFEQYSSDLFNSLYRLNLETYVWEELIYAKGEPPTKRNDHTASLWQGDKLIIFGGEGGIDGSEVYHNDVVVLDLKTLEWFRPEVSGTLPSGRIKHTATIHDNKLYIVGGVTADAKVTSDMNILDLETWTWQVPVEFSERRSHTAFAFQDRLYVYGGYKEEMEREDNIAFVSFSNLKQVTRLSLRATVSPMAVNEHFVQVCGGHLIVFISQCFKPSVARESLMGIWSLDLQTFEWQQHEDGALFAQGTWWHHSMAPDDPRCFFIGADPPESDDYFGYVLQIDLREYGIGGSSALYQERDCGIAADLGKLLVPHSALDLDRFSDLSILCSDPTAPPIMVHKVILIARWPHYANMIASGMVESRSAMLTIPEPPDVVSAFVSYLYTDSIANLPVRTVADLLVLSNLYLMPRLATICTTMLHERLSINDVAVIYHRASVAGETGLKQRALKFIFSNIGAVGRTDGFRELPRDVLMEVFDFLPRDASVVAGSPGKPSGGAQMEDFY